MSAQTIEVRRLAPHSDGDAGRHHGLQHLRGDRAWQRLPQAVRVVPRTRRGVPAVVRVGPTERGVAWNREYRWPAGG